MTGTLAEFNQLTDAEQYFEFFGLPYDPKAVNINRLHILKQFSNAIRQTNVAGLSEAEQLEVYRKAFIQAYDLFLSSSGVEQKLFKVFNEKPANVVLLKDLTV